MNAMEKVLGSIQDNRILILLTEIGALIHDLGKLSSEFVRGKSGKDYFAHHLFLKRLSSRDDPYVTNDEKYLVKAAQSWLYDPEDSEVGDFSPELKKLLKGLADELGDIDNNSLDSKADEFCKNGEIANYFSKGKSWESVVLDFIKLKEKSWASERKQIEREEGIDNDFVPESFKTTINDERWEKIISSVGEFCIKPWRRRKTYADRPFREWAHFWYNLPQIPSNRRCVP